jgi:uncharacterized integral membrane protein
MAEPPPLPARFVPLSRASRARRTAVFILGPLIWLVALLVLAFVVDERDAVEFALIVLAASFLVGLVLIGWTRVVRVREEREA